MAPQDVNVAEVRHRRFLSPKRVLVRHRHLRSLLRLHVLHEEDQAQAGDVLHNSPPWLVDEELNGGIRWLLGAFTDNLHPLVDVGTAR